MVKRTSRNAQQRAIAAPGVVSVQAAAEEPARSKEKTYVVKIGTLIVGKHEQRTVGDKVHESELTQRERQSFLSDGTIVEE